MPQERLWRPLTKRTVHLCIDMQNMFSPGGPWPTPWMDRVVPVVTELVRRHPDRTVFTRFITPERPDDMPGTWQRYYERWQNTTRQQMNAELLELVPPLARFVPPATVVDKTRYSAFVEPDLITHLRERRADGLIITGSETDVCVLATALGAVDHGIRVVIVRDAICSSSDAGHDALLTIYQGRYSEQIEIADAETILSAWN
jgi:nicotinamidase-related amidase